MEFRIDRTDLAEAVAWAARALPARTPVPVLGGLLLEAEGGGRLGVAGFDFETSAHVETETEVPAPGRVLVPGRRLLDICKVLPAGPVVCVLEGTRFTVEAGGTRFGVSTLPCEEYPEPPAPPAVCGAVDAAGFAAAVGQVAGAAGRDDTLPVLTGMQLRLEGAEMTLSASDRYRYAVRRLPWRPAGPAAGSVMEALLPARRLLDVARSLARCGTVRIGLGEGLAGFDGGRLRTVVRQLDGRLPGYGALFDMAGAAVAEVDGAALTEAVRRVAVVAEANSPVRLDFSSSAGGSVLLRAGYGDDVASQRLPAVLEGAEEVTVAFNPAYLLEAVTSFEAPRLRLELLGAGQRALLGAADAPGVHRHLLMAVKNLL
ncbi:DNA polymerase III subunit beta [Streptomyces actuosus]|uniref:DNA polymerase III subunit beta n=1 Tax=Streptomyces actuosus TaxID=1885 RepID=A0ABS2VMU6_STRAS|nr:DNA polymerase III subunit beta [Streptomyces actuosus]MBN0044402.1 DNA polymerase III subunit beta [Streptomyces actuosus]